MIKKVQSICLEMLDEFINVCKKYNLAWFADFGTLLGAVRKGKMIDWDDDIDISMPREDYNKLLVLGPRAFKAPYFFQTPETDTVFAVHAKIRMNNTTAITTKEYKGRHHRGIFIDILPIDSYPENEAIVESVTGLLRSIGRHSNVESTGHHLSFNTSVSASNAFNVINGVMTDISRNHYDSEYVGSLMLNRYSAYIGVKLLRSDYDSYIEVDFEGLNNKLRIPIGYQRLLTAWYGVDWHIEKQEPDLHHEIFYDTERNYTYYNNISEKEFKKLCTIWSKL